MKYHVSILDTDLYKLTQANAVGKLYPTVKARYTFINRDQREFPEGFGDRLREIVDNYRNIYLQDDEYDFVKNKCYYLDPLYLDILKGYRYNPSEVYINQNGPWLEVLVEGLVYRTIYWEVPLMEAISELYFEMTGQAAFLEKQRHEINKKKAEALADVDIYYSEFGARRRYSYINQAMVVEDLKEYGKGHMLGTSNVYLAFKNDLTPLGTVAHEFFMLHGAMFGYKMANKTAMDAWLKVYNGNLGIALTDTFTSDVFFRSFDTKYAKLFDGLRQDSGSPHMFAEKAISHYKDLRIDPMTKVVMFSDSLDSIEKIKSIHDICKDRIIDRYGIGTWLSNDVGVKPLNIVIKLSGVDFGQGWTPTVKLSDHESKHTGILKEVKLCKQVLGIEDILE